MHAAEHAAQVDQYIRDLKVRAEAGLPLPKAPPTVEAASRTEQYYTPLQMGIGVALWRYPRLRAIAAPPVLTSWLVLISLHAAIDTYNDFEPLGRRIDFGIARSSEIIELLIAAVGFLYGWLHGRILRGSQRLR